MARRDARVDEIADALSHLGPVDVRPMFSGFGAYVDGAMLGLIAGGTLYLKTDDGNRAIFEEAGLDAFTFTTKRGEARTSFLRAPEPIDDWDRLAPYALGALAAAQRARAKRARTGRRGTAGA